MKNLKPIFTKENILGKRRQLCWDCKKCMGKCQWSRDLKPMAWTDWGKEVRGTNPPVTYYTIYDCPEFVQGKPEYDGFDEDGYVRLAVQIVKINAKDYMTACYMTIKYDDQPMSRQYRDAKATKERIERFFHSGFYGALSDVDPDYMIEHLKAKAWEDWCEQFERTKH